MTSIARLNAETAAAETAAMPPAVEETEAERIIMTSTTVVAIIETSKVNNTNLSFAFYTYTTPL